MKEHSFSIFSFLIKLSTAVVLIAAVYCIGRAVYRYLYHTEDTTWCYEKKLSDEIGYCLSTKHKQVYRLGDHRILLRDLDWLVVPDDPDQPLACYSKKGKRGFIDRKTGQVVANHQYRHAWLQSDSLAAVVGDDGLVKFIDSQGNIAIADSSFVYEADCDYQFENGLCVMTDGKGCRGMIDRQGKWRVLPRYTSIYASGKDGYWKLKEADGYFSVADSEGKLVVERPSKDVEVNEDVISVTYDDHTIKLFLFDGQLMSDFAYNDISHIKYGDDEYDDDAIGVCKCLKYEAGDSYVGLMSPEGHRITGPVFTNIKGVAPDLYLCSLGYETAILLNGKGEEVKQ